MKLSSPDASDAILAQGLTKRFGEHLAVDNVSFSAAQGSVLGVLGPNGAGKSTTVNMLSTLLKPDAGNAWISGHDVVNEAAQVRRKIMLTGQFAALDESLTGEENLILFGRLLGLSKRDAKNRAEELLNTFDLTKAATRRVANYSGGMRRRVDIACGLVVRPEVVFLDEPTTGLDPRSRQDVWDLVSQLRSIGVTTLLTTQYLEEADLLCDNIIVIDKGSVVAEGTANDLKERTGISVCDVVPTFPTEIGRVREVLHDLLPPDYDSTSARSEDTLSIPAADGTDTLVEVVRRLGEAGIAVSDVALRRPSLDDAFLHLTSPTGGPDAP